MGLESSFNEISDLNEAWPLPGDLRSQGDDHIRGIKRSVRSLLSDIGQIGFGLVEMVLVQPLTQINYSGRVVPGGLVTVRLVQDGVGGRDIEWGSVFVGASTEIQREPLKSSTFLFFGGSDGKLRLAAPPIFEV